MQKRHNLLIRNDELLLSVTGDPLPISAYPINTEEKKQLAADWRTRRGSFGAAAEKARAVIAAVEEEKEEWKGLSWGAYGLCWGGKVCVHLQEPLVWYHH